MERRPVPDSGDDILGLADSLFREGYLGRTYRSVAFEPRSLHGPLYRRCAFRRHIPHGSRPGYALALGYLSTKRVVSPDSLVVDIANFVAGISRKDI